MSPLFYFLFTIAFFKNILYLKSFLILLLKLKFSKFILISESAYLIFIEF